MFTLEEYIKMHELGVSHLNPQAARLLADHLRAKGYVTKTRVIDGKRRRVWMRPEEGGTTLDDLKLKLAALE
jgi:hypothetical protein